MTEPVSTWADFEAGITAAASWPAELRAVYEAALELALTIEDRPREGATVREVEAWVADYDQAEAQASETADVLQAAITEGRITLTPEVRRQLGEAMKPLRALHDRYHDGYPFVTYKGKLYSRDEARLRWPALFAGLLEGRS